MKKKPIVDNKVINAKILEIENKIKKASKNAQYAGFSNWYEEQITEIKKLEAQKGWGLVFLTVNFIYFDHRNVYILTEKSYKIIKYWSSNNQPNNCTINIPKQYVKEHDLLKNQFLMVTSTQNGILIQPLKEVPKSE